MASGRGRGRCGVTARSVQSAPPAPRSPPRASPRPRPAGARLPWPLRLGPSAPLPLAVPPGSSGALPGTGGPGPQRRTRRHRTIFSEEQLQALEALFVQNQYPDVGTRERLAGRIRLREERVEVGPACGAARGSPGSGRLLFSERPLWGGGGGGRGGGPRDSQGARGRRGQAPVGKEIFWEPEGR